MKKTTKFFFSLFLAIVLILGSGDYILANTEIEEENIIIDGDFELGGKEWSHRNKGEVSKDESYDGGKYSGMVPSTAINEETGMADGYIGQVIKLEPYTDYTVSAYLKVDVEGAKAILTGRWWDKVLWWEDQGPLIEYEGKAVDQVVTSTDWTKVSYQFNSENNKYALIQLVKWSDDELTKSANAFIDNVVVNKGERRYPRENEYNEIWRDDFDQNELNEEDWGYELGLIRGTEHQHYVNSEENVFIRDGKLVLRATDRKEEDQYTHPQDPNRRVIYNSGSIRTHGKREFLYGKIEMRAKLPKGKGVFPAFWTLGSDFTLDGKISSEQGRGWPLTGEIDIMELIGAERDGHIKNRTVHQNIHYGLSEDDFGKLSSGIGGKHIISENFNDDFHLFALEWNENDMIWYVDKKPVYKINYSKDPLAKSIFNRPQYLQLNLAMGGKWPGHPGEDLAGTEFIIDYVSYSQTEEQAKAAEKYYQDAPTILGVEPLTMYRGSDIDVLENVSTIDNYVVDFSIEDSPMFENSGGNTNVELLVSGKKEMSKISELPSGKYNIHYTAFPQDADLAKDPSAKVARKSTTLTILPNILSSDVSYTVEKGTRLSEIELPKGWKWMDADYIVMEDGEFEVYYDDIGHGEREKVSVLVEKIDFDILDQKIKLAKDLIKDESYTQSSRELLNKSIELIEHMYSAYLNQDQVNKSVEYLDYIIERLEKVTDIPSGETPTEETPTEETPTEETPTEETPTEETSKEEPTSDKIQKNDISLNDDSSDLSSIENKLPSTGVSPKSLSKYVAVILIAVGAIFRFKKYNNL